MQTLLILVLASQVLTNSQGERYDPGTPSYVPLIDNCLIAGGTRAECIEALPSAELKKLEALEAQRGAILRYQMRQRQGQRTFGGGDGGVAIEQPRLSGGEAFNWNELVRMPREDAIALAYSDEYSQYRPGILSIIFQLWAREDPFSAHSRLRSLPTEPMIYHIENQVIGAWMAIDAHGAMAAAAESEGDEVFAMALNDYAHLDPEAALSAAEYYSSQLDAEEWRSIIRGVADTRPDLAARHVAIRYAATAGDDGEYLLDEFIGHLARQDPAGTLDWLSLHFPDNTDHLEAIATSFFVQSPERAFEYLAAMPDGTIRQAFTSSLCQAKSVNEESRARSGLPQPPPGYADGVCPAQAESTP